MIVPKLPSGSMAIWFRSRRENGAEVQRTKCPEQQKHPQHEAEIADAVDDERLLARVRRRLLQEIKPDQQVAAQPHAFPAHKQQHIVRRQHQDEHEKHEQVQIGEEAVIALFMRHVTRGINVNQETDAGDHQQHHDGQLVELQIKARAEIAGDNPIEELLHIRLVILGEVIQKFAHRFQCASKRKARGAERNAIDQRLGPVRAQQIR